MLEQYVVVRAIEMVVSQPNRAFSIRELASCIKISPAASKQALDLMLKKGMVSLKVIGKTYQFKANLESSLTKQWKILFNVDKITDSGIINDLLERIDYIHCILLYGSFAKGTNSEKSDIDLLVITQKQVKIELDFLEKLDSEVNISIMPLNDWKKRALENKVFYENVIFDSIVLHGERPVVL